MAGYGEDPEGSGGEKKKKRGLFGFGKKQENLEFHTHPDYDFEHQSTVNTDLSHHSTLLTKANVQWVSPDASVKNLVDLFRFGANLNPASHVFGSRAENGSGEWEWLSYRDLTNKAEALARGINALPGIAKGQDSYVAICMKNSPLWLATEQALFLNRRIAVALFDDSLPETVITMCRQLRVQLLICSRPETLAEVEARAADKAKGCASLKFLYLATETETHPKFPNLTALMDKGMKVAKSSASSSGATSSATSETDRALPSDLAFVYYTSTTDGSAKAVAITHANFVAASANVGTLCGMRLGPKDLSISYISMAHIFAKSVEYMLITRGIRIAYTTSASVHALFADMKELQPTILPTLPQMLNLFHEKIRREVEHNPVMKLMLKKYLQHKDKHMKKEGIVSRNRLLNNMTGLGKQSEQLGGNLRLVVTGAAAVSKDVVDFWRLMMACVVVEGYGLTETCGAVTITNEADPATGHVGPPAPTALIRLADVPDMGLSALDRKGEIWVKGPTVAKGYIRHPGDIQSIVDKDGWFHTGDVGEWTDSGCLRLVDRVRNLLKLPQGCFVAPEKLELVYQRSKWVSQIYVTGHPLKTFLVAVAVLDMTMAADNLKADLQKDVPVIQENGVDVVAPSARPDICKDKVVRKAVLAELEKMGRVFGLANYEIIKGIILRPEPFTVENGLLTVTGKLRRHEIQRRFGGELTALYAEVDGTEASKTASSRRSAPTAPTSAPPNAGRTRLV